MSTRKDLGWTFDTVASSYEKFRPGYAAELYQRIFDYCPIDDRSKVVEVGSGSGQATAPMLMTGCRLTAVECGTRFSELLNMKFGKCENFSLVTGKFEESDFPECTYDLVFAATAFHWVPEKIGYEKVYDMLRSGGAFARFANHPYRDKGNPALTEEINDLYDAYYYAYYQKERKPLAEYSQEQARDLAMLAEKYGFGDLQYAMFYRKRVFSAAEYVELLGTYSDHVAIEETFRTEFFSKVETAINRHGGTITIYDTMDLQLARKP